MGHGRPARFRRRIERSMRWLLGVCLLVGCTKTNPLVSEDLSVADYLATASDAGDAAVDAAPPDLTVNPCAGQPDGTPCGVDHACRAGLCAPTTCGNHIVDPGEECDDQNLIS